MQFHAVRSLTIDMSLDEVIKILSVNQVVDGILLMGTTGTNALNPTSDFDMLLVFSDAEADAIPRHVTTSIDSRLSEIDCTTIGIVEQIVAQREPWSDLSEQGVVLSWLRDGRVAHDRDGRLREAQQRARQAPVPVLPGRDASYEAWRKIGYNIAQMKRYLGADDPVSELAIDLRLLYSLDEVKAHYFTMRQLPWRGEKPAIRYWLEHDPAFLECLRCCLSETDRVQKVSAYERLARLALAPVGGLWEQGSTVVALGAPFGATETTVASDHAGAALRVWQEMTQRVSSSDESHLSRSMR